jgi:hypothetical protein
MKFHTKQFAFTKTHTHTHTEAEGNLFLEIRLSYCENKMTKSLFHFLFMLPYFQEVPVFLELQFH